MKDEFKSIYRFEGRWFDIFDMLVGVIKPTNAQRFSVWESRRKTDGHLLIVYDRHLADEWQQRYRVTRVTEPEFQHHYKSKIKEHVIHGYNEFSKNSKSRFLS
ncbi:MAG: hypothetical protein E6H06_17275 [Bacteroidetes bacterium]|nr:MAG: hypothetical protein E6H06_17275 [Bacteroidota bacterium]